MKKRVDIPVSLLILVVISIISLTLYWVDLRAGGELSVGVIALALGIVYLLNGLTVVHLGEKACLLVFGAPLENIKDSDLPPGWYIATPGIISIKKISGLLFQDELPADPEKIFRKDDVEKVPDGMFPPIRVKFGQPGNEQDPDYNFVKDDPYNIAMVAEVVPVISWQVASAPVFFQQFGSIENCRKVLMDKTVGVFGEKFSKVTPAKASLHLAETSQELEKKLREDSSGWGIRIDDAYIKPFIFSHPLNTSVVEVSITERKAKSTVITARAEKERKILDGQGVAEARRLLLEAEAAGVSKLAQIAGQENGQVVMWMETVKKALEGANYSIVPGGEFFSAIAGISEAVKRLGGNK